MRSMDPGIQQDPSFGDAGIEALRSRLSNVGVSVFVSVKSAGSVLWPGVGMASSHRRTVPEWIDLIQ
jgi:hypothetical protein